MDGSFRTIPTPHVPVLLGAVLDAVAPRPGDVVVDGTFGAGGYTRALLAAGAEVIGIDRDPGAIATARALAAEEPRFTYQEGTFGRLDEAARGAGHAACQGVVLDIGVSSMQLDEAERGFSFLRDGPLDMRMARAGRSAADLVNEMPEADLADIIYRHGEERRSRRIARAIVEARRERPLRRTGELADIVARAAGPSKPGIHPATRTFQALRIAVNDELGELRAGLAAAEAILAPGGRLCVVTFHSLEDRIVKDFLAQRTGRTPSASRHLPVAEPVAHRTFEPLTRKPITAEDTELATNPRARSAKLRVAIRTAAPAPASTPL